MVDPHTCLNHARSARRMGLAPCEEVINVDQDEIKDSDSSKANDTSMSEMDSDAS